MDSALCTWRTPNEPVLGYLPASPERVALRAELNRQQGDVHDVPLVLGARAVCGVQAQAQVYPHAHARVLAQVSQADPASVSAAIAAALNAHREWSRWSLTERASIFLKAADLLAGPWRARLNAATMLGQSKTIQQAEIDSACELIDFLRMNVEFANAVHAQQPLSPAGVHNVTEYRPLEGFVYAATPFNFTAIGGNLPAAPALMGNVVVWKPAATAAWSNYLVLKLLQEAGLPDGVINFVPGDPAMVSAVAMDHPEFAGLHFTGSSPVFDQLWQRSATNLSRYRNYPRLVGETGGKDFVVAHASADVGALVVALLRGAFEYQGQKCSAASRAYLPRSLWPLILEQMRAQLDTVSMGDIADLRHFMGAVIDARAFTRIRTRIEAARSDPHAELVLGGRCDDREGYFIEPTVIRVDQPDHPLLRDELFGPVLTVYVYDDPYWPQTLDLINQTSPYGLTGAVFAQDRRAVHEALTALRYAAGNFYINDKPTGAVVGQQPFGGARRSGTNDKAGSPLNLLRWVSPRVVKETRVPPLDYRYPNMAPDTG